MSRRVIDRTEYRTLIESFTSSLFRMETLNEYQVPFEEEAFARFLRGEPVQPDASDDQYRQLISRHHDAGRQWQVVHVVDLPLSDYLRYEIASSYDYFSPAGEDVRMIERREGTVTDLLDNQDFWLFDDSVLVLMHYDNTGQVLSREIVEHEPNTVAEYARRKEQALAAGIPYKEFCAGVARAAL